MKVAVIGKLGCHIECLAFLLEMYKNKTSNVYISRK